MQKITKEVIVELAEESMLTLSQEEIDIIYNMENIITKRFEKVKDINTENIAPAHYPFDDIHNFLREDISLYVIDRKEILTNAPEINQEYITIKRVVK
ncbi:Asp-tRNA(Asn)/Glu-tRNA(Gln) amidotransferase subunit GatC [Spiroplasma endosymbiont of Labia minor]|uniref:Asp-tRNA(Asn)/Glu-tRNA(Gln) amidotransferase subunit GatC n=1 Tax=Spiroplasma endosymbiont of Labia minor TaxID=3066305 RepID=UPI0030D159BE